MEKEIWKDIEGYEGLYQVSNLGRVRSLDNFVNCRSGAKQLRKGKILQPIKDLTGYFCVNFYKNNKMKRKSVHRIVAETFIPNPHNYPVVNHLDGVKTNDIVSNLEWTTHQANIQHAFNHGLRTSGADNPRAKLTWEQVKEIRKAHNPHSEEFNISSLAKKYGVSPSCILRIIRNITYYDKTYIAPKEFLQRKLTFAQAEEIRERYSAGNFTLYALAEKYGVSKKTILNITQGKIYKPE